MPRRRPPRHTSPGQQLSPEDQVRDFSRRLLDRYRREQAEVLAYGRAMVERHRRRGDQIAARIGRIGR